MLEINARQRPAWASTIGSRMDYKRWDFQGLVCFVNPFPILKVLFFVTLAEISVHTMNTCEALKLRIVLRGLALYQHSLLSSASHYYMYTHIHIGWDCEGFVFILINSRSFFIIVEYSGPLIIYQCTVSHGRGEILRRQGRAWWSRSLHQWPGPLEPQSRKYRLALSLEGERGENTLDASGRRTVWLTNASQRKSDYVLRLLLYVLNYAPHACTSCICFIWGKIPFSIQTCFSGQRQIC